MTIVGAALRGVSDVLEVATFARCWIVGPAAGGKKASPVLAERRATAARVSLRDIIFEMRVVVEDVLSIGGDRCSL
jgi:hypothetical protein